MDLWVSRITASMVEGISPEVVEDLFQDLDKAVANICQEYGVQ